MRDFLSVLGLALLPAGGTVAGSLVAESVRTPRWVLGAALHAAAGIAIAVVSFELMPRIRGALAPWLLVSTLSAGAVVSVLLARGVEHLAGGAAAGGPWMVYLAVAADLFSDGMLTSAGSAVSGGLGLATSQLVANVPGGFAPAASFRGSGVPRGRRLAIAASFPVPAFVSAALGLWLLRGAGAVARNAALGVIVGVLLLATVEDTLPQGDAPHPPRWISTLSFAGGFALFAVLSSCMGEISERDS